METVQRKYAQDAYMPWLSHLVDFGDKVEVRDRTTKEVLDAVTVIEEPQHHCILIPARQWNPWIAMSEALWILAGRDDVASLKPYNKGISDYSDDGVHMYGAYGRRIFDQIDELIKRLERDPSDRRAVLSIWDARSTLPDRPPIDLVARTKDPPCNNMLYFKLRKNRLHMTVICRSNDLHYGLFAVNIPTFGILQEYIAARLGVELGYQTHLSNSLHIYTDEKRAADITDRMMYSETGGDRIKYPHHEKSFTPSEFHDIKNHEQFAKICSSVLDGYTSDNTIPLFLSFAGQYLRQYQKRELEPVLYENFPEFGDWNLAARIFADRVWKDKPVNA